MTRAIKHRPDYGRAARAADLIAILVGQLPPGHRGRATLLELQKLYPSNDYIRERLVQVPGKSMAQKGRHIGVPRAAVWAYWNGKYQPTPEVMARIEAAAQETVDAE